MAADTLVRGLREQIVERLRGEILAGRLAADTPLREVDFHRAAASAVRKEPQT